MTIFAQPWFWQGVVTGIATALLIYSVGLIARFFYDRVFLGRQNSAQFRKYLAEAFSSPDAGVRTEARQQVLFRILVNFVVGNVIWVLSQFNFYGIVFHTSNDRNAATPLFVFSNLSKLLGDADLANLIFTDVATLLALFYMLRSLYWALIYQRSLRAA